MTPQRMAILKVISNAETHPAVDEIYDEVRKEFPMTSLATVYKTIGTLKGIGEINEIIMQDGSSRVDGQSPESHPHMICLNCGEVIDVEMDGFEDLTASLTDKHHYKIKNFRLDFFGICPNCQAE